MSTESIEQLIRAEAEKLAKRHGGGEIYAAKHDGMPFVIVRAYSAGVFAGYLASEEDGRLELINSRFCRTFETPGEVDDVTDLAMLGLKAGHAVRPMLPRRIIRDHYEWIPATELARSSIEGSGG
jgi:hypothetical protein